MFIGGERSQKTFSFRAAREVLKENARTRNDMYHYNIDKQRFDWEESKQYDT